MSWACGIALGITLLGLFLATRSFVLEAIVRPHIMATVGGEIEIGSARWVGWAQLEVTDLTVRAPGWSGPSGEVLRIDRGRIELDPAALRRGSFELERLEVDGMRIRIAEDVTDPGRFSILSLEPELGEGGRPPRQIDVLDLVFEAGTDNDGEWRREGRLQLAGELISDPDELRIYEFTFITGDKPDQSNRSVLQGRIDTGSLAFNATLDDLTVGANLLGMLPIELREATKQMQLAGHVERIEMKWDVGDPLYAALVLDAAELTIPDLSEDIQWARLDKGEVIEIATNPKMQVTSGRIALEKDQITLADFTGRFISELPGTDDIPVRLDVQMDLSPILGESVDWSRSKELAAEVFDVAPFNVRIEIPDFEIRSGSTGVVLPAPAARTIGQFGVEEWLLDIVVDISRGAPARDTDGTLEPAAPVTEGQVRVERGAGRYSRFPYPLENVRANIRFDDSRVDIESLTGRGPNGGDITVRGSIIDPGPAAAINVDLRGRGVPADATFRSSLDSWRLRTWDRFFDRHAEEQLSESGVLPDATDVAAARQEQIAILKRLNPENDLPEAERAELLERSKRLKRIVEAGPFELGGSFDFDLNIFSKAGIGEPVDLTGDIHIIEGDVLLSDFPYPTRVIDSTITLERDMISLGDGITFTTPDGGTGMIRGTIETRTSEESSDALMRPDISFAAIDVEITPALLDALPPGEDDAPPNPGDWPGRWRSDAAMAMAALGISGSIDLEGTWQSPNLQTEPELAFDAILQEGTIAPNMEFESFFARAGFIWPENFILDGCSARIHLDDSITRMTDFIGNRHQGIVEADGYISRSGNEQALHVRFNDIKLEDYLLDLMPQESEQTARELWDRFRPRGRFDADLDWSRDTEDRTSSLVVAWPRSVTLDMEGVDVLADVMQGALRIEPEMITLQNMLLELQTPDLDHGSILLDGTYGRSPAKEELLLTGQVEQGRFQSPSLTVLLDLVGADRVRESWLEMQPSGRFDAHFEYRVLEDNRHIYAIDAVPESLSVDIDGDRIHAAFESGAVFIAPGRINLDSLVAQIPAPGLVDIDGVIGFGDQVDLMASIRYRLDAVPNGSQSYFPPPLSTGFNAVDFATKGPFQLDDGVIKGLWEADASILEPTLYTFEADVDFKAAEFVSAATFDRFDGSTTVRVRAGMNEEGRLESHLDAPIRGSTVDVQERTATEPRARLVMNGDDILHVEDIEADAAGGRIVGESRLDLSRGEWELELDLENASLQDLTRQHDADPEPGTIGTVLANLRMYGRFDDPDSKRGRGRIIIDDGKMTNSPLVLSVVQLSQFMLPVSGNFDFAEIGFMVDGNRMIIDDVILTSPTLQLVGEGEMSLKDWELAVRLAPKGTVPILSDLIGGVTNTLYAIRLKGTLDAPEASLEPLPLFGGPARIEDPVDEEPDTPEPAPSSQSQR